ncbi:dihydroxyacetone kinase subunit L [Shumkonia mesophila]|uniref:dihydroxyacetone kinase subunit L n=1 Tax=Shumkonia mesophila TaxID=2838854 RepID=UPI0029349443|nr:dihydroxyacetone kinase subunit L [Shumkonia mesophila]
MALTTQTLKAGFARVAAKMAACAEELNALDGAVGDGDLGITMSRGSREVVEQIDSLPDDLGIAFMKTAQAFTKTSGSTFGTLIATGFMAVAKSVKGRTDLPWAEVPVLLGTAIEAMKARGKAELGDKTVLDALAAARDAIAGLDQAAQQLVAAKTAVDAALAAFRDRPNKVGRARIFADKTIGRDDPGMVAFRRVLDGLVLMRDDDVA